MSIITKEMWDNLPNDFKEEVVAEYNGRCLDYMKYQTDCELIICEHMRNFYGKENLENYVFETES